ncbi:NADH-quinone oxidoreductase subunit J [Thermorudis peleae]|uniref:NADH-quinone oxidoreductase subunit J family protein n=1 Tax=Thermorudis peleae TaxID=1382356 RepID=UPI00056FA6F1|nr:NADH-quinone oxidoreductase subunit J [Thermorudis peleae]MBX6752843.1 NADH-quinone oxidoreductase subunit J [Thermorudis peleae]
MSIQVLVFYLLAIVSIGAAAGVVLARNPVHSAIALMVTFINVAAIYVMLRAEFLAVAQVIVYTGAILVLVVFVLMLVQQQDLPEFHGGRPLRIATGFVLGILLLAEVLAAILTRSLRGQPGPWTPDAVAAVGGNIQAIGRELYSAYTLPIQVTAIVLLMATIGAIFLARPETLAERIAAARRIFTISLGHPKGTDLGPIGELPAPSQAELKPASFTRPLILAKSADEFTEQPAWGEVVRR